MWRKHMRSNLLQAGNTVLRSKVSTMAETTIPSRTGLYYHPCFQLHNMGDDHVERPARTRVIYNILQKTFPVNSSDVLWQLEPRKATIDELLRFHTPGHVSNMLNLFAKAETENVVVDLDPDTSITPYTGNAAQHAAGAVCEAVEDIMSSKTKNAFCIVRPPGHHAEPQEAMGFCFFNNIGIAVQHARQYDGINKCAVVDFDVHHGNGTQEGFENDVNVLFISSHQGPDFYPGTGEEVDSNKHPNILNYPLEEGSGSDEFKRVFEDQALPSLEQFEPDIIFISAGFDAHTLDPLADINLRDSDYRWATERIIEIANKCCGGRVVSVLEGGYNLTALARAPLLHVQALVDAPFPGNNSPTKSFIRSENSGIQMTLELLNAVVAAAAPTNDVENVSNSAAAAPPTNDVENVSTSVQTESASEGVVAHPSLSEEVTQSTPEGIAAANEIQNIIITDVTAQLETIKLTAEEQNSEV